MFLNPRLRTCPASSSMAKVLHLILLLAAMVAVASSFEFRVGEAMGWRLQGSNAESFYNQWAERNRFQIGDSLLFVYPPESDSVLLVTKEDYESCDTASPPAAILAGDGNIVFTFDRSGPFYFISGKDDNCKRGEKMVVVVLADRSKRTPVTTPPFSPAPAPDMTVAPPAESSPSPPPPGTPAVEIVPTAAPPEDTTEPNRAVRMTAGLVAFVIGSVGAVLM